MSRSCVAGLVSAAVLAWGVGAVRADVGPGPSPSVTRHLPSDSQPQRTGPFRSCGSGMGLGLAGIGASWAMLWLGNRFAGRVSRNVKK